MKLKRLCFAYCIQSQSLKITGLAIWIKGSKQLPSEHERVGRIGNPQLVYKLRRHLIRTVQMGVAIKIASPIDPSEGVQPRGSSIDKNVGK